MSAKETFIKPFLIFFFCLLAGSCCSQSILARKTVWTVPEVKEWAESQKKFPSWYGNLLYQGSDSLYHHFISRVMDEWIWFAVSRPELKITDEHSYSRTSSAPLGYYYVDATKDFMKTDTLTDH